MSDLLTQLVDIVSHLAERVRHLETAEVPVVASEIQTIASDAITISSLAPIVYLQVDTQGAAGTDDLATINGGFTGMIVVIQTVASTRDVTLKHGTGNLNLNGSADFTLDRLFDKAVLVCRGAAWDMLASSNNA